MLADILTIASKPSSVLANTAIQSVSPVQKYYVARPTDVLTIAIRDENLTSQLVDLPWGVADPRNSTATLSLEHALKTKKYNILLHNARCAIPVNCFFCKSREKVYLVRVINHRVIWLGGIVSPAQSQIQRQFLVLNVEAADVLLSITDRMPVLLNSENIKDWLYHEHVRDVVELADNSGDFWFDYYQVDPQILNVRDNSPDALRPVSLSLREQEEKKDMLDSLDFSDERFNRNNSKGR